MKTALLWLILYVGGLLSSFIWGPIVALSTYMFTFYTQFSWASYLGPQRWSLYAGLGLLIVYLVKRDKSPKLLFEKMPQFKWLLLILLNMLILTPFAAWPEGHNKAVTDFVKIVVLYYLIIKVVQNKLYYKIFIWVQIWGNWLLGWQAFSVGKSTHGRLENIGGPRISGSNLLSAHIVMILPFIGNRFFYGRKWERSAALLAAPFVLNALILCNSRGAFLAMLCMAVASIIFAQKGMRLRLTIGLVLGAVLFVQLTDRKFWTRMDTIETYQEDGSAMGRVDSWKAALQMISDFPFGKGGGGWHWYSPTYIPEIVARHKGQKRTVHNTYLMMATDWGIQGLILLLAFLGSTFLELHKIRKRTGSNDDRFYHTESVAIEISIIGFLVAAFFLNRIYAESLYWYCALATALSNMQQNEILEVTTVQFQQTTSPQLQNGW